MPFGIVYLIQFISIIYCAYAQSQSDEESHAPVEWSPDEFHERLSVINFDNIDDIEKYYSDNLHMITEKYGVLLFMYAVFLTKVNHKSIMNFNGMLTNF